MSDQDALMRAVVDQPEDDLPRLALADLLEEGGGPEQVARAELIRTEIELDRLLAARPARHLLEAGARERLGLESGRFNFRGRVSPQLEARDAVLLGEYGTRWAGGCAGSRFHYGFRRGFVGEIRTRADNFVRHGERVLAAVPVLAVRFVGTTSAATSGFSREQFWRSPVLGRLRYLNFCHVDDLLDDGGRQLAHCPLLAGLRELSLWSTRIGREGATFLADARHLTGLVRLDLGSIVLGPGGAVALAGSPVYANLRWLRLWSARVGDEGVAALAASPHLAGLTDLNLGANGVTDVGWQALAASRHLTRLTTLSLASNPIGPGGARALADSPALAGLTRLKVSSDRVGRAGVSFVEPAVVDLLRERFGDVLEVSGAPTEPAAF